MDADFRSTNKLVFQTFQALLRSTNSNSDSNLLTKFSSCQVPIETIKVKIFISIFPSRLKLDFTDFLITCSDNLQLKCTARQFLSLMFEFHSVYQ